MVIISIPGSMIPYLWTWSPDVFMAFSIIQNRSVSSPQTHPGVRSKCAVLNGKQKQEQPWMLIFQNYVYPYVDVYIIQHTYTIVSSSIVSLVGPSAGQAQSHLHFQPPLRLHSTSGHPLPSAPNESALCQSQDQNTQVKKHGAGRRALHVWLGFMVPWLRTQLLRLGMTGGMTGVCI